MSAYNTWNENRGGVGAAPTATTTKKPGPVEIGNSAWLILHTGAAAYDPETQRDAMSVFIRSFADTYPCSECRPHFVHYIHDRPPEEALKTRKAWRLYLMDMHNWVNARLGKSARFNGIQDLNRRWGGFD